MLETLNAILAFFNLIVKPIVTIVSYTETLFKFLGAAPKFLTQYMNVIPPYMLVFAGITLTLSIVLLIVGRSNNRG